MSTHKIAIAARLRPRLPSEQADDAIQVFQDRDDDDATSTGGAHIAVTNPRDPSQVFKFPYVFTNHFVTSVVS
jgi:kinesin family protein 22